MHDRLAPVPDPALKPTVLSSRSLGRAIDGVPDNHHDRSSVAPAIRQVHPKVGSTGGCVLSVVVPVFNECETLPALHRRLQATMARMSLSWEILYVDDGSTDSTPQSLDHIHASSGRVSVARLSRNFGKEAAITAGLRLAHGEAVIVIDADLQDPPELICEMVDAWLMGADVVNMRRRKRHGETWLKRSTAYGFYRIINRLSDVPIPHDVGDFRLLSRRAVNALNEFPERTRFMKGLFAWIGFRQTTIDYDREARVAGESKWPYAKLWRLAVEGLTSFTVAPLKLATHAGLLSAMAAFVYAGYFFLKTLAFDDPVHGFPTLIVTILLLGGLQLMAIGIVGEYLGRLLLESKHRPLYLLDDYRPATVDVKEAEEPGAVHAAP